MERLLEQIQDHLSALAQDPTKKVDEALLDQFNASYISNLKPAQQKNLVHELATTLPSFQGDPAPVLRLAILVVDNSGAITFGDVLSIEPRIDLTQSLESPSWLVNELALALLGKALTPADAGIVAGDPKLVFNFVNLWLRTSHTQLAERARRVFVQLLSAEPPEEGRTMDSDGLHMPGLMWRRVFSDKDIYELLYALCSNKTLGEPGQLTKREKTLAQGRLLDLLQVEAIARAPQLWISQDATIESKYGVELGCGLMDFAAIRMVDYKDDVLMHTVLVNFFTHFISLENGDASPLQSKEAWGVTPHSTQYLDLLISRDVHDRTMSYFLDPDRHDPLDVALLYSSCTEYIAAYANHYKTHFITKAADRVVRKLTEIVQKVPNHAWAGARAPTHDLKLLASVPQKALLWVNRGEAVLSIPLKPTNRDALNTLAAIFRGPDDYHSMLPAAFPPDTPSLSRDDQIAARVLFFLYLGKNLNLFDFLISTAEVLAVQETALAAVHFLGAIVNSCWASVPSATAGNRQSRGEAPGSSFPTEDQLRSFCPAFASHGQTLPHAGALVILSPPAVGNVMRYLMEPAAGTSSEAAWEVAVAKHDVLKALRGRLQALAASDEESTRASWTELIEPLLKREREGVAGRRVPGGGRGLTTARVATVNR